MCSNSSFETEIINASAHPWIETRAVPDSERVHQHLCMAFSARLAARPRSPLADQQYSCGAPFGRVASSDVAVAIHHLRYRAVFLTISLACASTPALGSRPETFSCGLDMA